MHSKVENFGCLARGHEIPSFRPPPSDVDPNPYALSLLPRMPMWDGTNEAYNCSVIILILIVYISRGVQYIVLPNPEKDHMPENYNPNYSF